VTPTGEQLCYTDAYARSAEARVVAVEPGDVTLIDTWGVGSHAPRRVLARVLAQIARGQMERPSVR